MNTFNYKNILSLILELGLQKQFFGCVYARMMASCEVIFSKAMHSVTKRWFSIIRGWAAGG
ncbi:hypothetical protein [Chlamydia sp.]|uniref:hypothetical protein n=1 Tax=Chlamydia sp. TaxID=35827 RepID=UPI0025C3126D|nr:hypothetical protein [Chlamydia sp.]MBQ8498272.1 hypothetical protein [Chlamydia sp.]